WVEPDAHRVLAAEHLDVAHALDTAERVDDVGGDVVGDVLAVHRAVFGHEADDLQEAAGGLADVHALALHFLRTQRHGQLQLVLHLDLGDVRGGGRLEGPPHGTEAAGRATGREVNKPVQHGRALLD